MQLDTTNHAQSSSDTESMSTSSVEVITRAPIRVRVDYTYMEDFLVDYTSNHTIGGMFIKTDRPLQVGSSFILQFQLPGTGRMIEAEAVVRWTLPKDVAAPMIPGMGVRFTHLSTTDRNEVEGLLADWR